MKSVFPSYSIIFLMSQGLPVREITLRNKARKQKMDNQKLVLTEDLNLQNFELALMCVLGCMHE